MSVVAFPAVTAVGKVVKAILARAEVAKEAATNNDLAKCILSFGGDDLGFSECIKFIECKRRKSD